MAEASIFYSITIRWITFAAAKPLPNVTAPWVIRARFYIVVPIWQGFNTRVHSQQRRFKAKYEGAVKGGEGGAKMSLIAMMMCCRT